MNSTIPFESGAQLPTKTKRSGACTHCQRWSLFWANIVIQIFIMNFNPGNASKEPILQDLQRLASTLPGCYSNVDQYYKHVQRRLPPEKRHFLLKSEIYKMANPVFNDSLTFYFQDFTSSSQEPFRSGFYSFSVDPKLKVIRMRTLKQEDNAFIKGAFKTSRNFTLSNNVTSQVLRTEGHGNDSLRTYSACDMFWKRLGESTFVGITGPLCLGSLGSDQVRIGVSMTLTKSKLLLTESWYKLSDGTQITEIKVPYILQKLKLPETSKPVLHKSRSSRADKSSNNIDSYQDSSYSKSTPVLSTRDLYSEYKDDGKRYDSGKTKRSHKSKQVVHHRVLRNFRQVAAALTSGQEVYYRVELSACSIPDQVKVERVSFGGMLRSFVYVRGDGVKNEGKDYIYFLSHKTVMGSQGPEFISRQLTLLREGRVKVEIVKTFLDPAKVKQGYEFECRLYDDHKGYGGVKLAVDPTSRVKSINNFGSLATSVDQGRDLHIVADLAQCLGSRRKPSIMIGSQILNYDFVNGGKTVEIFIPFVQKMTSGRADVRVQGFAGQILKNGDVILTLISNSQSRNSLDNVFHLSPAYHCSLSNRNSVHSNSDNERGVKLFYIK